jgi:cytoskeleton protein RodZ
VKTKSPESIIEVNPPPATTMLGERLRRARESRGISLREISEQSRIPLRYLESIEHNDYKPLPGGIFNRSFVKAYAKHVGIDEREALEAYEAVASSQGATTKEGALPQQPRVYTDGSQNRSPLITILIGAAMLSILTLGVYAGLNWYEKRSSTQNRQEPQVPSRVEEMIPSNPTELEVKKESAATSIAPAGLKITLKAKNDVWIRVRKDNEPPKMAGLMMKKDETKEFFAEETIRIEHAKNNVDPLDITVNDRPISPPTQASGTSNQLAEVVIEKGNYEKYLQ